MELETINRLYLELSQVATATTAKEIELRDECNKLQAALAASQEANAGLIQAIHNIRDSVRHGRYQLADEEISNEATNAILYIINDETNGLI